MGRRSDVGVLIVDSCISSYTLSFGAPILTIHSNPLFAGLDPLVRRGLELQTLYTFQAADGWVCGFLMPACLGY